MRFLRQSLTGLLLLSIALGLLVWAGVLIQSAVQTRMNDTPRMPQVRERVFAVNVVSAPFETVTPVLTAFGEVQSRRTLELRTAIEGTLIDFNPAFVEGGRVAEGTLLARIQPADLEAALESADSDLDDAKAELQEARRAVVLEGEALAGVEEQAALRQRVFERQKDLEARSVGTTAQVEEAELGASTARQSVTSARQSLATAEARVNSAQTALARAGIARAEAQRRLDETEIRAPFDAQLSDVAVVAGRRVSANEQLASLVDPNALEVVFRVSVQQYARLLDDAGALRESPVLVVQDLLGGRLETTGRLTREGAAVGEGQTGRLLYATLERAGGFKPGDFVTVEVTEPPLNHVARLPATALDAAGDVLVIGDGDRLESIPVTLLRRQGDDILVRGEALAGREVVSQRTPLLGAGIKVRTLRGDGVTAPPAEELVALDADRRARLIAFVEANTRMPAEARESLLAQLAQDRVPASVIARLEDRMGS